MRCVYKGSKQLLSGLAGKKIYLDHYSLEEFLYFLSPGKTVPLVFAPLWLIELVTYPVAQNAPYHLHSVFPVDLFTI